MPQTNQQIADLFNRMAEVLQILGANRFRVVAYERAARALENAPDDVASMTDEQIGELQGIGASMVQHIREYLDTGKVEEFEENFAKIPAGLYELLDIPGMGPKTVAKFWQEVGIESLDDLKAKLDSGELEKLKGFGKKKIDGIRKSLAYIETAGQRVRIGQAMPLAEALIDMLGDMKQVKCIDYAGSLRRGKETIGDIDLLVAADSDDAEAIGTAFAGLEFVEEVLVQGKTKTSIRTTEDAGHMQADLRVVEPASYGAALLYFTGSKEHNVRLRERAIGQDMRLNEYGLWKSEDEKQLVAGETEQAIYEALGLAWTPPELREDLGEIKQAEAGELPDLVELDDIVAELHTHTTASDGKWSIRELAEAVADQGFHTLAVTDHSRSQVQANGLDEKRLKKHIEAVRKVAEEMKDTLTILAGSEVDILKDGELDYSDELLAELDLVVASPHAALTQDSKTATDRLLKAMENPYVTILGHPTGRLVGRREGLSPDMRAVTEAAARRGIALEINANSYRLDLRDSHARLALEAGCKLSINTDAHGPGDLGQRRYGVLTARRAGATKADIVNCMTAKQLQKWLKSTRPD